VHVRTCSHIEFRLILCTTFRFSAIKQSRTYTTYKQHIETFSPRRNTIYSFETCIELVSYAFQPVHITQAFATGSVTTKCVTLLHNYNGENVLYLSVFWFFEDFRGFDGSLWGSEGIWVITATHTQTHTHTHTIHIYCNTARALISLLDGHPTVFSRLGAVVKDSIYFRQRSDRRYGPQSRLG